MILVQCVKSKKRHPAKAKNLYDSVYWDALREYAEASDGEWMILSAKHGLLDPETVIKPYDEFGLTEPQCREIGDELVDIGVSNVEVIAGKKYTNPLTPELEAQGIEVVETCRGLQIGKRVSELQYMTKRLENESLC